jgi:hypothetical protein
VTTLLPPRPEHPTIYPAAYSAAEALANPASLLLASVVERLYREYEDRLSLPRVLEVVLGCLHDIQATPAPALPELTERLARHRLAQLGQPGGS